MDYMHAENETVFLSWLSSNVSPAQLSELYLAFSEIEQQAKKSKLIRRSLYEDLTVPAVKKIRADIERSRIFKFTHKRQWSRILSALNYLQKFAVQNQGEGLAEKVTSSIASQDEDTATDNYMNSEELKLIPSEKKETEEVSSVHADEAFLSGEAKTADTDGTVHFDSLESMAFTKPISFSYFGDMRAESSWKGLYVDACVMLYEDYPEVFARLREESLSSAGKTWLVDAAHVDTLAVPKKLVEDFYVETNRSATDLIKNLKWLLDECSVDYENVVISYSRHTEPVSAPKPVVEPLQRLPRSSYSDENGIKNAYYAKKLEELALAADMQGISYDDARDAMRVTMVATKQAAADAEHIVDIKGRLFHEEAFIDWEDGAAQLEGIIDKLMQKNGGYIAAAQLYEYAKVEMNMFLTDNDLNDERSVYDIATHLFEKKGYHNKHYSFYGKMHISRTDHPITSNLDIFRNFAAEQGGIFSFDSLVEYLHSIGVASGNLRMQMRIPDEPIFFYYENGILIYADNMHIDDAWISAVKKELTILLTDVGGHIVLRAVPDMWLEQLPALPSGKHWTPLLLQSVLRCYSKDLGAKTIQALSGQSLDTLHAMLVANDSPIQTFGDVVVSYLVENDIDKRSFEAETLRLLLVDAGIIQGNELIWNMPKALGNDERFAWNASGDHVIVEV